MKNIKTNKNSSEDGTINNKWIIKCVSTIAQNFLNLEYNYDNIIKKLKNRQNDILEQEINQQYENY